MMQQTVAQLCMGHLINMLGKLSIIMGGSSTYPQTCAADLRLSNVNYTKGPKKL